MKKTLSSYLLNKRDIQRALFLLEKALEEYKEKQL